jgi:hypothetical protein
LAVWVWLAEAEKELGLNIPDEALEQMKKNVIVSDASFAVAREYEEKFRHDVMAFVHAYGQVKITLPKRVFSCYGKSHRETNTQQCRKHLLPLASSTWGLRVAMVGLLSQ